MHSIGGMRWTLAFLLMTACAVDDLDAIEQSIVQKCDDPLICPGNSDLVAALGPFELNADKVTDSSRGFHIVSISHLGVDVPTFQVQGAKIHEIDANDNVFDGAGALSTIIRIHHTPSDREFDLKIVDYRVVPFYSANFAPTISGYYIQYKEVVAKDWKDICPYKDKVDAGIDGSWAVFWKGDRYDPDTGKIYASGGPPVVGTWFNISCAGEALIKMLRMHTGQAVAPFSPIERRLAVTWMFTATFCKPGTRYTHLGVPLVWSDLWEPSDAGPAEVEAIWSAQGAVCLNTPRDKIPDPLVCNPPECTDTQIANWDKLGWVMSALP